MRNGILLIVMILTFISAKAQVPFFTINTSVSMTSTTLKLDINEQFKSKPGFGLGVDVVLGRKNYVMLGASYRLYNTSQLDTLTNSMKPFQIFTPGAHLYYGRRVLDAKLGKLILYAGPHVDFSSYVPDNAWNLTKDDIVANRLSIIGGVQLNVTKLTFGVEAGYGLNTLSALPSSGRLNYYMFRVGFNFL